MCKFRMAVDLINTFTRSTSDPEIRLKLCLVRSTNQSFANIFAEYCLCHLHNIRHAADFRGRL